MDKKHKKLLKFTDWVIGRLGIKNKPQIRFSDDKSEVTKHRTFGSTTPNNTIWVHVGDRNTADVMRTLCHELVHAKQFEIGTAKAKMAPKREQGIEDEANAVAGRMMRKYGKMDATIYESKERACCAELRQGLLKLEKTDYDTIDRLMKKIAKKHNITPKQLHDYFVETHGVIPDTWIKNKKKELKESDLGEYKIVNIPEFRIQELIKSGNEHKDTMKIIKSPVSDLFRVRLDIEHPYRDYFLYDKKNDVCVGAVSIETVTSIPRKAFNAILKTNVAVVSPHIVLDKAYRQSGLGSRIYSSFLYSKNWVFITDRHTEAASKLWNALSSKNGFVTLFYDVVQQKVVNDVNENTFRLIGAPEHFKIKLSESREGSLTHEVADSLPHAYVLPDINSGNPYLQYKFGVAIASARGAQSRKDDNINPFDENGMTDVFSDKEFVVSFDPHIDEIITAALKKIGMPNNKKQVGVKGSKESNDVAKVSPVIGFKGF